MKLFSFLALIFLMTVVSHGARAQDPGVPDDPEIVAQAAVADAAKTALAASDFATLDRMETEYRATQARTPAGVWKLAIFYKTIVPCLCDFGTKNIGSPEEKIAAWKEAFPNSPAPYIGQARVLINNAFFTQNTDTTKTPPEDWAKQFQAYLEQARQVLETHKGIASVDPQYYVELLVLDRLEKKTPQDIQKVLQEALPLQPAYQETYFEAMQNFLPESDDNANIIDAMAVGSAHWAAKQEGVSMYTRIYLHLAQLKYGDNVLKLSPVTWGRMKKGFVDMVARYPAAHNYNNYAKFACLAGDLDTARSLRDTIGKNIIMSVWGTQARAAYCLGYSNTRLDSACQEKIS